MKSARQALGRRGEDEALAYFLEQGHAYVDRNWRCRAGEIDLIMERGGRLYFVEVKARQSASQHPFEAIPETKRLKLEAAIQRWLQGHPERAGQDYQVDAFCLWQENGQKKQAWIQGI